MSTDEYSTEMELYGVRPGVIAVIMFFTSLIFPFGFFADEIGMPIALIMILVNPIIFLPLTLLNILYAICIVRYYQAKSSKNSVLILGLLSLILPTVIVLYLTGLFGEFVIVYPVPIQFIVGLIIMWKIEGPEVISPWFGMRLNLSWWKWRQPRRKDDWDPFEEEKKALENED